MHSRENLVVWRGKDKLRSRGRLCHGSHQLLESIYIILLLAAFIISLAWKGAGSEFQQK